MPKFKIIIGNIVSPVDDQTANYFQEHCLLIKEVENKFVIQELFTLRELKEKAYRYRDHEILDFSGKLIIPTFCDLHFHWVQNDVRQMPKDNLLDWLKNHTWPTEANYQNEEYSKEKAIEFSKALIDSGTLSGAVYGSIHEHSVNHAHEYFPGDFIVGNVQMTMNSPDDLLQQKSEAIELSRKLSKKYKNRYAVTPRFAITTHPEVMKQTALDGDINRSFIQTHLCETKEEIDVVMDIFSKLPGFESVRSYTEVYELCGLLGPKSIFGHGIHLNIEELKMLKLSSSSLAHCPTSNAPVVDNGLGSGLFDLDKIQKHNISWALASDIGAGPYLSMIDVMDSFVRQHQEVGRKYVNWTMALNRATLAGEKICDAHQKRGNFRPGKDANFLVIDHDKINSSWGVETLLKNCLSLQRGERSQLNNRIIGVYWQGQKLR